MDICRTSQAAVIQAFSTLVDQPEVLIVDTATGISDSVARFVGAAHQAIVVVCDEPASLTDAYALIKVLSKHYGITHFDIVTNQTCDEHEGRRLYEKLSLVANDYLDVVLRHLGDVPQDQWLRRSVKEQRCVADAYPSSPSGRAFSRLACAIDRPFRGRKVDGSIQFFLESLLCADSAGVPETI
jgi:flagellar biosynthesis protein FlhG